MVALVVNRIAAVELADSKSYYNRRQKGLADDFEKELLKSIELIIKNPFTDHKSKNELRKVVLKHFPFVVYMRLKMM